jgi:hypothetical protein
VSGLGSSGTSGGSGAWSVAAGAGRASARRSQARQHLWQGPRPLLPIECRAPQTQRRTQDTVSAYDSTASVRQVEPSQAADRPEAIK